MDGLAGGGHPERPRLTIAMPTRNRPELLERALGSALEATAAVAGQVEVTVSDGSDGDASGQVVRRLLADWPGGNRYVHNQPALSLPEIAITRAGAERVDERRGLVPYLRLTIGRVPPAP